jgi:hypothetical protein
MRNILAHDYFTRQSEIIWETLKAGLPELAAGCRAELARLGSRRLGGSAHTVVVRTLPRDVRATANLVIASPLGISTTRTTSYWPVVT